MPLLYLHPHHIIKRDGETLLYNPDSMVILRVDELAERLLSISGPIDDADITELAGQWGIAPDPLQEALTELVNHGVFRSAPVMPKPHPNDAIDRPLPRYLPGLWIMIAQDCNLRCQYCSAGHGTFGTGQRRLIDRATVKRAIDYVFENLNPDQVTPLDFAFMGGEPLMNFPVLGWAVEYVRSEANRAGVQVRLNMNTNGTLMTEQTAHFFVANGVHVTFSIDGQPAVHNAGRPYERGLPSYSDVIRGLEHYRRASQHQQLRTQSVLINPADLESSIMHLYELGTRVFIANRAFNSVFLDNDYSFSAELQDTYFEQFRRLNDFFLTRLLAGEEAGFVFILRYIKALHGRQVAPPGCGAGRMLAINTDGEFYACQSLMNDTDCQCGSLSDGVDWERREEFFRRMIRFTSKCMKCWGRYLCGGACIAAAINDDELELELCSSRCGLYQRYMDEAIWMYYRVRKENPSLFDGPLGRTQDRKMAR